MTGILNALIAGVSGAVKDAYFNLVSLLLPGDGTNGAQNNTFLDGSSNTFTITRNGNTTQGTFSPFSQTGWGNYFSGSGQYFSAPSNAAFSFSTSSFTVEAWVYLTAATNNSTIASNGSYSGADGDWIVRVGSSGGAAGKWEFTAFFGGTAYQAISNSAVTTNTWAHIAAVKNGNTMTIYVNGVAQTTTATNTNSVGFSNQTTLIGSGNGFGNFPGYISNLRIVKGVAVYTGNFTVPINALTATQSAGTNISAITGTQTSLLTCQSNRFIDNSVANSGAGFTLTLTGSPSVTPFSPFAPTSSYSAAAVGGSGYFDGTLDSLTGPTSNSAFAFGTGAYSVEAWVYLTGFDNGGVNAAFVVDCGGATNAFNMIVNTNGSLALNKYGVGAVITGNSGKIALNSWNHIAICRNSTASNDTRLFVNGALDTTGTDSNDWTVNTTPTFGGAGNLTTLDVIGYLSGIRIIKSQALATSAFTPPTAPVSASTVGWNGSSTAISGTCSLLLNFTNAGVVDATAKNVLETVGNAQISTTQSKWGGGSISFDGTGDWLLAGGSLSDLTNFGAGNFTLEAWVNFSNISSGRYFCGKWASSNIGFTWYYESNLMGFAFTTNGTSITDVTRSWTPSTGVWYYVAITRNGADLKFYVDGSQIGATYNIGTSSIYASTSTFAVGQRGDGVGPMNGYIDDFRITKGLVRTVTTVPTAPFPVQ
jgi:hypothetical protein